MTEPVDKLQSPLHGELESLKLLLRYMKSVSGGMFALIAAFPLSGYVKKTLVPVWSGAPILAFGVSMFLMMFAFVVSGDMHSEKLSKRGRTLTVIGFFFAPWIFFSELVSNIRERRSPCRHWVLDYRSSS